MIDLKAIENDIKALESALCKKREEYKKAKESNLKEQYGNNFGCHNCAYGCCVDVGDYHTCCTKNHCIHCRSYCDNYMPDNELSLYIKEHHYYDESTLSILDELMETSDIMKRPELHPTALEILKLRDKKEN